MTPTIHHVAFAMALGRIAIGLAPFVAARLTSRAIGFPAAHDSASARLMARLFGVRDVGLGVLVFYALRHPETAAFMFLFNAAMDAGDLLSAAIPLVKRQGIDRGAVVSGMFATGGATGWILLWSLS